MSEEKGPFMRVLEETRRRMRERIQQISQRGVLGTSTREGPIRNIIKSVRQTIQERIRRASRSFQ